MLDWLACFAFNWFQRDLCLQLNIRCRRNSANTLSVEFTAKSFFPISPGIKKTDSRRRMYFGDPRRRGLPTMLPTVRFDGAAIESAAVKQTLTETKRLDTRPKYPKRCKEKYQKTLFRLSFKPDLANCARLTKIDSTHWRQRFSTARNVFFLEYRARHASRWTWAFKLMFTLFVPPFISLSSKLISIEYWVTDLNGTRSTMFYQRKILLGILLLYRFVLHDGVVLFI